MTIKNDAILQELIKLDRRQHITGRKNYRRLSELQTEMLNNSFDTLKRAMEQTDFAFEQTDKMLSKYAKLEEANKMLEEENAIYYFALADRIPEIMMHHC